MGPTVARWTAPADGTYTISAAFKIVQVVNTVPTATVFRDGVVLGSGSATDYSLNSPGVALKAGTAIDFVVGGGMKTTQVEATINAVGDVKCATCSAGQYAAGPFSTTLAAGFVNPGSDWKFGKYTGADWTTFKTFLSPSYNSIPVDGKSLM